MVSATLNPGSLEAVQHWRVRNREAIHTKTKPIPFLVIHLLTLEDYYTLWIWLAREKVAAIYALPLVRKQAIIES